MIVYEISGHVRREDDDCECCHTAGLVMVTRLTRLSKRLGARKHGK